MTRTMTATTPTQVLELYRAAVYAKDVEALMQLYAPDVRVFDMWGTWAYDGADAWRTAVSEWFGSLGSDLVRVEMDDLQHTQSGELAVLSAFVTYRGLSAQGQELRSMNNRLTLVCRQDSSGWQVIHEHSSSPADFESGKVLLRRG
ncbi:YybH family protein [Deinococcus ruber]|uniref:Ketosteroid isomerase n=1 Tax=Deinococcus ruber TaxID=1848197 RepID=A0A918F4W5_9DEIO|nr:nuclear transport factor 2 family protein [Deinococcus ruber]GGR01180.1 ketosteroid isomerase [Deinococcus ruber]